MKKLIYIFIVLTSIVGCSEEKEYLFRDVARIQFVAQGNNIPEDLLYSFVYTRKDKLRDTVYLPLRVLGGPLNIDRQFNVSQIEEYNVIYEYDNKGHVIDSTIIMVENKAIPGIHYVAFDDPEVLELMKVRANLVIDSLPVILLRDKSLLKEKVRLKVILESSDEFQLGERGCLTKTIIFSDKLEQPTSWNYVTNLYLGRYSEPKHELIMRVVKEQLGDEYQVNDDWFEKGNEDNAIFVFWRSKFVEALNAFNKNPENIASGKAPLREDPENPNSNLVTFPSKI